MAMADQKMGGQAGQDGNADEADEADLRGGRGGGERRICDPPRCEVAQVGPRKSAPFASSAFLTSARSIELFDVEVRELDRVAMVLQRDGAARRHTGKPRVVDHGFTVELDCELVAA